MSAFVKGKLKTAREAIGKKDYERAREASLSALDYEPENYNANVFLGLALLNLGQSEQSEQVTAYRKAIDSSPDQLLAWQGISQLYDQTHNWTKYVETLEHLSRLFAKANDAVKCAETLQKIIELRRDPERGTRMQFVWTDEAELWAKLADVLSLMLPDSSLYPVISTLPPPDPSNPTLTSTHSTQLAIHNSLPILEEIVSLHEREEEAMLQAEVSKRRMRLGAPSLEQIQREVGLEVLGSSRLPNLYNEILNHPNTSDELRRATESKLLRHKQRYLYALPATGEFKTKKVQTAAELDDLVSGMVLLGIGDELAWSLYIESKDVAYIEGYDFNILRQYIQLFPSSPLTRLLIGYFGYMSIPLSREDNESPDQDENEEDFADMIIDAFGSLSDSILAHRVMAELYEQEADLENTIKVAEGGLELVCKAEQQSGKSMPHAKKTFNITLATSLVHFFPPKHHARALDIIEQILHQDADNVSGLMGRGFILQHAGKWADASKAFARVVELIPDDFGQGIRAKEEYAWCQAKLHDLESAAKALQDVIYVLDELEGREDDKARCWWRLGVCHWDMGDDHQEEAYGYFITSLKRSSTFAPAFTSLGIYYSEFLSPPDPNRASKCFQKAFELDPREADAARRLAEGFAEEREWDLVEVVAKRTIDGEGGLESGADSVVSRRYLPLNAWAWKAVGVVELNRQNYSPAIQAFQIALRTDVDDQVSWLRLGEAYSKAGRFAAALKALERARELDSEDWVPSYFIGDVQRQMGGFEEAIQAFESILRDHPSELGVLSSLGLAYLDRGRAELAAGYAARAEASFISSILMTLRLINASHGFRRVAWKTVADAIFQLSAFSVFADEDSIRAALAEVIPLVSDHPGKGLSGTIPSPLSLEDSSDLSMFALEVALAAYDYRLSLSTADDASSGSSYYDLGVALCAYARKVSADTKRERCQQEAINRFKEALRIDPSNDLIWVALGNATFISQPRTCQHAYIKALDIDSKNAASWTNLGLLYLHNDDAELANEAFYRAQTLDPDYALAWVGQALVATVNGHELEASALFEHAVGLTASVPEADLEFATRVFKKANASVQSRAASSEVLLPAFFVLDRFCKQRPTDVSALHLFGLVCERIGHVVLGIEMISRAISLLEAAYEETEDPTIERQFTTAHTNMARLRLSISDYEGALESYQVVLGLLAEASDDPARKVLLVQAQFGSGLANFKLGLLGEALALFEAAMETAADDPVIQGHVVVLLAQTLWAMGTKEARESAKSQLLQSIEYNPENLMAINTLAGMGILTDDDSLVDAALSELLALPLDQRHERDPERDVTYLLVQHHLGQDDAVHALSVAEKAVFAEPSRSNTRRELATLTLQHGASDSALAVISGSAAKEDNLAQLRESLGLHSIALCMTNSSSQQEAQKLAQKAIMLSPWDTRSWQILAYVRSRNAT
ncbi:Superkiller protein 3 [Grifola frondosa]|uniref:Superkiller protein 3 n=1 Tax=Grifola frondosa TaxID=5627 RepID=A0A1C7LQS7_GRIFR|nr:Superkiller protein 3 [Grifola frondosa]